MDEATQERVQEISDYAEQDALRYDRPFGSDTQ